jgi:hypothetical protein
VPGVKAHFSDYRVNRDLRDQFRMADNSSGVAFGSSAP